MPRAKSVKNNNIKKPQVSKITCLTCGESKKSSDFYASNKVIHAGTGRVPYCKSCIRNMSYDINGKIDVEKFKNTLREIDKPFIYDLLESAYSEASKNNGDVLGIYFKNLCSLPQYKNLGFSASAFNTKNENKIFEQKNNSIDDYNFSNEILERWKDHPIEDIPKLEEFYTKMQEDNRIESVQDKIYLKKLAVINLEQDKAAQRQDWGMFDKLGTMFSKFMMDAKLRAQDRSEADRTGGVRNFCNVYSEVEKDDFIPPWIQYRKIHGLSQDVLDYSIMHIENFTLRLSKHERMFEPPKDTPQAQYDELDLENSKHYSIIKINKDEEEDVIVDDNQKL